MVAKLVLILLWIHKYQTLCRQIVNNTTIRNVSKFLLAYVSSAPPGILPFKNVVHVAVVEQALDPVLPCCDQHLGPVLSALIWQFNTVFGQWCSLIWHKQQESDLFVVCANWGLLIGQSSIYTIKTLFCVVLEVKVICEVYRTKMTGTFKNIYVGIRLWYLGGTQLCN